MIVNISLGIILAIILLFIFRGIMSLVFIAVISQLDDEQQRYRVIALMVIGIIFLLIHFSS
jgi:hypothetical protein